MTCSGLSQLCLREEYRRGKSSGTAWYLDGKTVMSEGYFLTQPSTTERVGLLRLE
jgi:hypothetical protein